ncbi:hypothetical protein RchiOBHm_Chr7g0191601 [Rosa chinensis]|uniref:Uncharacterized protein n=1 Tax=Rosa chinensis TaxID=74649 RepID=A0A2P6P5B2_ROSCH|nr:hypothetical protein RchiOBHm_Chr7g0191601 [Rosa chinensis]
MTLTITVERYPVVSIGEIPPGAHGGEVQLEAVKVSDVDEKLRQYQNEIVSIIHKYLLSDGILKLIQSLEDLAVPEYNPIFLKKLITLAVE